VTGYEYGNTRLRAMRARLLRSRELGDLLRTGSIDRLLGALAETDLRPEVEAAIARVSGPRRLDEALRRHLARILSAVASFYDGAPAERVDLLLDRWIRMDLRAIVRLPDGAAGGDPADLLVPAGRLDDAALAEITAHPDLRSRMDQVIAWNLPWQAGARVIASALADYERSGDRTVVEHAVDEAFAGRIDSVLGDGRSATVLRAEIDSTNLLTALRVRAARASGEPVPDTPLYVSGGNREAQRWEDVAVEDDVERAAVAARVPFLAGWDEELAAWVSHQDLTVLADGLRRRITAAAVSGFVSGDPLGFDIPVAYVFAKEAEIRDIRLVGRALVHGLGPEVLDHLETAA
jgi:V/A-type H+-transporting ATPase subunit C